MTKFSTVFKALTAIAVVVGSGGYVANVHAQEKVTLKFADWMPTSHYTVTEAAEPFMKKATELSNGQLEFQYFPGEQLGKGKDALTLVQTGVADIANISPAYISDKFILSSVAELPAMFSTACEGTKAFSALAKGDGIIAKNEFAPKGVRVLVSAAYAPYKVMTVNKKIVKVEDFEGVKLRTAGAAMDMTANALKAVSVRMPGPEILPSLSRGTLDGSLVPLLSVKVFDFQTVMKHMTTDISMGSFITVYAISDRAWDSLSPEQKDALEKAGDFATLNHCNYIDNAEPGVIKELEKDGIENSVMADGEKSKLLSALSGVQQGWADKVDELKLPGNEVLNAFHKQVSAQ